MSDSERPIPIPAPVLGLGLVDANELEQLRKFRQSIVDRLPIGINYTESTILVHIESCRDDLSELREFKVGVCDRLSLGEDGVNSVILARIGNDQIWIRGARANASKASKDDDMSQNEIQDAGHDADRAWAEVDKLRGQLNHALSSTFHLAAIACIGRGADISDVERGREFGCDANGNF